jgi:hypothetical protein
MRACLVQGSQQIWVAALWYWGNSLNSAASNYVPPWWIVLILWPLAVMSFTFAYLMLYGLPEYYRQTPPKVPSFMKTLFRRKIVLWFLASELLRDYWLSGVSDIASLMFIGSYIAAALWSQLVIPLEWRHSQMANPSPRHHILRRSLGCHDVYSHPF